MNELTDNIDVCEHFTRITKNYTNIKEAPGGASTNETMKKIK